MDFLEHLSNTLCNSLGQLFSVLVLVLITFTAVKLVAKVLVFSSRGYSNSGGRNTLTTMHPKTEITIYQSRSKTNQATSNTAETADRKGTAVIKFSGDPLASQAEEFAQMVDEVILNQEKVDQVVVVINSPGGGVSQYGRLYAEMERIREAAIPLTACIDVVAASGGYLMALPSNKIVAAPWATVGSIGVVTEFVNFNELLTKLGIKPILVTAGKLKRTVTPLSPVEVEGVEHLKAQLESFHAMFKSCVAKYRQIEIEEVCTGDFWTAAQSIEKNLGLVDELATSHSYLMKINSDRALFFFEYKVNPWERRLNRLTLSALDHVYAKLTNAQFKV